MNKIMVVAVTIGLLVGCATKQYPQAPAVTGEESAAVIKQEIAKTHSVQSEIESTGQFDGRTVLGVLGDFGIANGMAKNEARKKALARLKQLESLKAVKCANDNS
ncbi:hypothetical protein [Citrobacter koseri]|uniref:hypothetical protein n=1 Tax=Citrobacter koseri TaxID=545 RepID=UPI0029429D08|nr:hypothetical protein [Citrobacter koseri]MEB2703430.1 hypothetical protein [Citrobacter koseri]MEB2707424.1 hypothetical protein [Citrobacter koseri]MEB2769577.1 hypothetical protein [Citrobacter koseri]WOJ24606.1 hypothetical protein R1221_13330 [Citrobacter koseri]